MENWIPAISTTSLLVLALWLSRNLIVNRLSKSIQHEFDAKLARIRADYDKENEIFKGEIRKNEARIAALQSGALSGLVTRQASVDKRRLEAIDQLWSSVIALRIGKGVSALMATIKFEAAAKEAAKNEKFRSMFKAMAISIEKFTGIDDGALKARPFVSPLAWAFFSAYSAIIMHSVAKANILQIGIDEPAVIDFEGVKKVLIKALPHQAAYVNEYGTSVGHYLLDELEASILLEFQKMIEGNEVDRQSVERAATIIEEAGKLSVAGK